MERVCGCSSILPILETSCGDGISGSLRREDVPSQSDRTVFQQGHMHYLAQSFLAAYSM